MSRFSLLQKAFTLVELLLVLLVIAALTFLSTRYFTVASSNAKAAQVIAKMNTISEASYTWLEGTTQSTFNYPTKISASVLIDYGLLTAGDIANPFDPTNTDSNIIVTFGSDTAASSCAGNSSQVKIVVINVPSRVCTGLEQKLKKSASQTCCDNGKFSAIF